MKFGVPPPPTALDIPPRRGDEAGEAALFALALDRYLATRALRLWLPKRVRPAPQKRTEGVTVD